MAFEELQGNAPEAVLRVDGIEIRRGVAWSEETARHELDHFLARQIEDDEAAAVAAYRRGTSLTLFFTHGVDVVLGYRTFADFCRETLGIGESDMYRVLRLAKRATADEAKRFGYTRALLGFTLLDLTKTTTLTELATRRLVAQDGEEVRFPATTRLLESCIRRLQADARGEPAIDERLVARAKKANARLGEVFAAHPALRRLRAKFVVKDGDLLLDLPPLNAAQRRALVKALAELD